MTVLFIKSELKQNLMICKCHKHIFYSLYQIILFYLFCSVFLFRIEQKTYKMFTLKKGTILRKLSSFWIWWQTQAVFLAEQRLLFFEQDGKMQTTSCSPMHPSVWMCVNAVREHLGKSACVNVLWVLRWVEERDARTSSFTSPVSVYSQHGAVRQTEV